MKPPIIISVNNYDPIFKMPLISDLAQYLSSTKKVLIIDLDPKGMLSNTKFYNSGQQIPESFTDEEVTLKELNKNISILQGSERLVSLIPTSYKGFRYTPDYNQRYSRVGKLLSRPELVEFDYVLLNTEPNLNYLTISSFVASDHVIIPVISDQDESTISYFDKLKETVDNYCSGTLVYTLLIGDYNLSRDEMIQKQLDAKIELGVDVITSYYPNKDLELLIIDSGMEPHKIVNNIELSPSRIKVCKEISSLVKGVHK